MFYVPLFNVAIVPICTGIDDRALEIIWQPAFLFAVPNPIR